MEQYYAKQASIPHFSGHYRQRGSGFGALAAGIGRVAIPFPRRVILPAQKNANSRKPKEFEQSYLDSRFVTPGCTLTATHYKVEKFKFG